MTESLEVYDLDGKLIKTEDRKKFYSEAKEEFAKSGKISRQVKIIRLLLLNSKGRIYLQKRSKLKNENPGLYDKTIGGHVLKGESWDATVVRECAEELGFPASILPASEFDKAILGTNLNIVGVFKKLDYTPNSLSVRITKDGDKFIQPFMATVYVGYYDGAIKFFDGESSGIETFSLPELLEEISKKPDKFTEDLRDMVKRYEKSLKAIK